MTFLTDLKAAEDEEQSRRNAPESDDDEYDEAVRFSGFAPTQIPQEASLVLRTFPPKRAHICTASYTATGEEGLSEVKYCGLGDANANFLWSVLGVSGNTLKIGGSSLRGWRCLPSQRRCTRCS